MLSIPLALYIHFPWCIQKCPYCDFLSYSHTALIDGWSKFADVYVDALLCDLRRDLGAFAGADRIISSIYIGGGTPTLLPIAALARLMLEVRRWCAVHDDAEITIEANPETVDRAYCTALRAECGINRISIGVQSFNDKHLALLGRVHNAARARAAIAAVQSAGFTNINIDLMFGLPMQSMADAVDDLRVALALSPTHLSWYQLTIEEGSLFYVSPPDGLPVDEMLWQMQQAGKQLLASAGFAQYEVSAYCQKGKECQHNLNYWQFGDYLGIGVGAHGKITMEAEGKENLQVVRYSKVDNPQKYLAGIKDPDSFVHEKKLITAAALPFEFMLNALRLYRPISHQLFTARTGLSPAVLQNKLKHAVELGLIEVTCADTITATEKGRNFLNDLVEIFL